MGHDALSIGIDGGGTATRAVVTTSDGRCIGYGIAGRGNPISAGHEQASEALLSAVRAGLATAGGELGDVSTIVAALAGQSTSGRGSDTLLARLRDEGFTGRLSFDSDLLALYFSGTAEDFGYALVAGTGACAIRVVDGRLERSADGLGWLLGDRGSGFWIGQRIAKAVLRDLDGTGPATALTPRLLDRLAIAPDAPQNEGRPGSVERLVSVLYAQPPIELAALAPLAFDIDDPVAAGILRRAGRHLADSLGAVLTGPGPVVIGGGVLARPGPVRDALAERLGETSTGLELRPVGDGAVGAGLLALRATGHPITAAALDALAAGLVRLR